MSTGTRFCGTHVLHLSAIPSERDIETAQYALNSVRNDIRERLAEAARRGNAPVGFAVSHQEKSLQLKFARQSGSWLSRMRTSIQGGVARESFHTADLRILIQFLITSQFHKSWKVWKHLNIRWVATLKDCGKDTRQKSFGTRLREWYTMRLAGFSQCTVLSESSAWVCFLIMVDIWDSRRCEVHTQCYFPSCEPIFVLFDVSGPPHRFTLLPVHSLVHVTWSNRSPIREACRCHPTN